MTSHSSELEPLFLAEHGTLDTQETNTNSKYEKTTEKGNESFNRTIKGFIYAVIASSIFTVNGTLVKHFKLDYVNTICLRSFFQIVVLGVMIKLKGL